MKKYDKQKLELLVNDPVFSKFIYKLRKKWKIPAGGFDNMEEFKAWEMRSLDINRSNEFNSDFDSVFPAFNLNSHYKDKVYEYLTFNTLNVWPDIEKNNLKLSWISDKDNAEKIKIFIEIFSNTTTKDIQNIWSFVNQLQKSTVGFRGDKKRNRSNIYFDRDKKMLDLKMKRKSNREIYEVIRKIPGSKGIGIDDVSKNIAKLKKKMAGG